MKLLLINPKFPESFWSLKLAVDSFVPGARTVNPPLGLATLAGLTPEEWEIEIVDENVQSVPLDPEADIVGVCGMGVQYPRQRELLSYYRGRGFYVVAGGSYASLSPEAFESIADTVVAGEAEYIWKEFCRDYENGSPRRLYHETGVVALEDSPTPRFDLLNPQNYAMMSVQFSRGCPYNCEFCDIIVMFGRRPRMKTLGQIRSELDALRRLGVREVFFVDDNLIGNKKAAKELLLFLKEYQEEHDYRFQFGTEVSINVADDPELLRLFKEARFHWVFIGIESIETESLEETGKTQNLHRDILESVRTIYSSGIDVLGGFIVGFDHDTVETFGRQYRFIVDSGIQTAMVGLLLAIEKTPLFARLEKEGRLKPLSAGADNSKLETNVIPKEMTYDELIAGYHELYLKLLQHRVIAERVRNKTRWLQGSPYRDLRSLSGSLKAIARLVVEVGRSGGVPALFHLARSFPILKPRLIPTAAHDWVVGLSMRDYVDRHFRREFEHEHRLARRYAERLNRVLARYLRRGSVELALAERADADSVLSFSIRGKQGKQLFSRATRELERMLRHTRSSVTIRIEEFHPGEIELLRNMLARLHRYRDRIVIAADEKSRRIIGIDSSVFNLAMDF